MDDRQFAEAIRLHGVTNRRQASSAALRGDGVEAERCHAVAAMAESGKLLMPRATEHNVPDLVAGAKALGRLVDSPDRPGMDLDHCRAAIAARGRTARMEISTAMGAGQQFAAVRLDAIATMAESGKLLVTAPGDSSDPDLQAAAAVYGLLVDASGTPVPFVPAVPESTVDPARVGGQPTAPLYPRQE